MYFAHSTAVENRSNWQTLPDHLNRVASLAESFAGRIGIGKAARLAGSLHDLGKYTPAFQARLDGGKERVDHSTAGAAMVLQLAQAARPDDRIVAELVAYVIAGHHAGLPDKQGETFSTLSERLKSFDPTSLDDVWRNEIAADVTDLLPGFDWARPASVASRSMQDQARALASFQLAFLGRMLFSCLVDADFKDTEAFYARVENRIVDRAWPALQDALPGLLVRFHRHMSTMGGRDGPINALRGQVLRHVIGRAGETPGLFTLTVPTGGGKTLASLGFALEHARAHARDRIIYAIPYTSIIDQTASIFRAVLGDEVVLEHHSAIEDERQEPDDARCGKDKLKLAMEDWAAPVVVTTNVQFFESLFAARTSRARKLHNIANSVIILDEAQTLPRPLMVPSVWALHELARNYGCTIVLCTATQPALDERRFSDGHPAGLPLEDRELAPDPEGMARKLRRVRLEHAGEMDDATLVAALAEHSQGLVIVNSRKHALALYLAARDAGLDGLIHLTTRQYAAHRREILARVRKALADEKPCRLIATSLVEAGVDLDFPRVWRAQAGLDQIAQAAGRCNREGRWPIDDSIVTVFTAPDNPPPPEVEGLSGDMGRMMHKHQNDLFSPGAMADYFGEVYWRVGTRGLDAKDITKDFRMNGGATDFAFRTVAEKFRMIESGMVPLIIPGDDMARQAIAKLGIDAVPSGLIARELQAFTVQVPPRARARLMACGHVAFAEERLRGDQFAVLRTPSLYEPDVGLMWEDAEYLGVEDLLL